MVSIVRHIMFATGILMVSAVSIFAQGADAIRGKLVDVSTQLPIPFATIKLKNRMMGVISNAAGDFQLPTRYKSLDDTLLISCIGYTTKILPMDQLKDDQLNLIELKTSTLQLSEVVVSSSRMRGLSVWQIVRAAIRNIPGNYCEDPFSYQAYYRDYQWKDNEYVNLNEAIVEVVDSGFETNDEAVTRVRLYEYKMNKDFLRDSTTEVAYDE